MPAGRPPWTTRREPTKYRVHTNSRVTHYSSTVQRGGSSSAPPHQQATTRPASEANTHFVRVASKTVPTLRPCLSSSTTRGGAMDCWDGTWDGNGEGLMGWAGSLHVMGWDVSFHLVSSQFTHTKVLYQYIRRPSKHIHLHHITTARVRCVCGVSLVSGVCLVCLVLCVLYCYCYCYCVTAIP